MPTIGPFLSVREVDALLRLPIRRQNAPGTTNLVCASAMTLPSWMQCAG
jgi:hypothetical protein